MRPDTGKLVPVTRNQIMVRVAKKSNRKLDVFFTPKNAQFFSRQKITLLTAKSLQKHSGV
jgi:hypothetical protein